MHCLYISCVFWYTIAVQLLFNRDARNCEQLLAISKSGSCIIYVYMLLSGWCCASVVLWRWWRAIANNIIFVLALGAASGLCRSCVEMWQSTPYWRMAEGKWAVQLSLAPAIKAFLSYTEWRTTVDVFCGTSTRTFARELLGSHNYLAKNFRL